MSLKDFLNRDFGAKDEYSGAPQEELVRKLTNVQAEIAESFAKMAAEKTSAEDKIRGSQWLIDRQVKIQAEINKRNFRWKRERRSIWIIVFFAAIGLIMLLMEYR